VAKKNIPEDPGTGAELTVGQFASRTGLAVSAIRFYESKGLIVARRTAGSRRRYAPDALQRVVVIKAAQSVGIPLSTVRELLSSLPHGRLPTAGEWGALLRRWQRDLDGGVAQLSELRAELIACARCGCLSLESCPLLR
jgi:MerR family redox-sensitive transcriptional activator SoxR